MYALLSPSSPLSPFDTSAAAARRLNHVLIVVVAPSATARPGGPQGGARGAPGPQLFIISARAAPEPKVVALVTNSATLVKTLQSTPAP